MLYFGVIFQYLSIFPIVIVKEHVFSLHTLCQQQIYCFFSHKHYGLQVFSTTVFLDSAAPIYTETMIMLMVFHIFPSRKLCVNFRLRKLISIVEFPKIVLHLEYMLDFHLWHILSLLISSNDFIHQFSV